MRRREQPYATEEIDGRTALVLSARGRDATVIGPGGAVQRVRVPFVGTRPGDRIALWSLAPYGLSSPAAVRSLRLTGAFAAAMVLALLIASVGMYFTPLPAVAMVSVDINPSVNLYVNSVLRVVSAQAADEAGEALLKDLAPARQPLGQFLLLLADRAAPSIATSDGERWLIIGTTSLSEGEVLSEIFLSRLEGVRQAAAVQLARAVGREPDALASAVIEVPIQVASAARESGVTPGQYAVLLAAQDAGIDVRISDTQSGGLFGALTAAGVKPGDILSRAAKDKDLEETWRNNRAQVAAERTSGSDDPPGAPPTGNSTGTPKPPDTGGGKPDTGQGGGGTATVPSGPNNDPAPGGTSGKPAAGQFPMVKGKGPDEAKQRAVEVIDRIRQLLGDGGVGRATDKTDKAGKGR